MNMFVILWSWTARLTFLYVLTDLVFICFVSSVFVPFASWALFSFRFPFSLVLFLLKYLNGTGVSKTFYKAKPNGRILRSH